MFVTLLSNSLTPISKATPLETLAHRCYHINSRYPDCSNITSNVILSAQAVQSTQSSVPFDGSGFLTHATGHFPLIFITTLLRGSNLQAPDNVIPRFKLTRKLFEMLAREVGRADSAGNY